MHHSCVIVPERIVAAIHHQSFLGNHNIKKIKSNRLELDRSILLPLSSYPLPILSFLILCDRAIGEDEFQQVRN